MCLATSSFQIHVEWNMPCSNKALLVYARALCRQDDTYALTHVIRIDYVKEREEKNWMKANFLLFIMRNDKERKNS